MAWPRIDLEFGGHLPPEFILGQHAGDRPQKRGAGRRNRRSERGRADLGDRGRGDEPLEGRRHRRLAARAPRTRRVTRRRGILTGLEHLLHSTRH